MVMLEMVTPSVDSSKPATGRHFKTGHHGRGGRDQTLSVVVLRASFSPH
jgi:hypothetical protein